MPKCKKIYPNCIWTVPPEWHGLNIYSALLTKFFWNFASDIVRLCVTAISPRTLKFDVNRKSNIQIRFGSTAMGSLYELLCHRAVNSLNSLIDELLSYLSTRFSPHIFVYIVFESSDDDPYHSDFNISAFYSDYSTFFSTSHKCCFQFQYQSTTQRHNNWGDIEGCGKHPHRQKTPWVSNRDPGSRHATLVHADPPGTHC